MTNSAEHQVMSAATDQHQIVADDHGYSHTISTRLMVAVYAALVVLTVTTVAVARVELGHPWNFVVAMVIASLKGGLVVAFFMHLVWDRKFNLLLFLTAILFLILFLGLSLNDRSEYQPSIDAFESAQTAASTP